MLRVLLLMTSLRRDIPAPLTLSEQLDAMLSGWLDRHAPDGDLGPRDRTAKAVMNVGAAHVGEIEAFCAHWDLTVWRATPRGSARAVLVIEGRELPVRGFTEITSMYRR